MMFHIIKKTANDNRARIFIAGMIVGSGVTYLVLKDRIILDATKLTLAGPDAIFAWLAETNNVADFPTKFGEFVLKPPTG
jgi:hypothetical protein